MNKLLVICGATATGKTSLSLTLAKKFNGELISADSRQVYKKLDIGTGKDLPRDKSINPDGSYDYDAMLLWGYDLVEINEEFSVAQYGKWARQKIRDIWDKNKLPILVGGTGFYIKAVIDGVETSIVPRNEKLRDELSKLDKDSLFKKLKSLNTPKANGMNESDRKNPARLIRAIEVSMYQEKADTPKDKFKTDNLWIGLEASLKVVETRIKNRINQRIKDGMQTEVTRLLAGMGSFSNLQSMSATGYALWEKYIKAEKSYDELIASWYVQERQYAKRQITWFKKEKRINWFDVSDPNFLEKIEIEVKTWHNKS